MKQKTLRLVLKKKRCRPLLMERQWYICVSGCYKKRLTLSIRLISRVLTARWENTSASHSLWLQVCFMQHRSESRWEWTRLKRSSAHVTPQQGQSKNWKLKWMFSRFLNAFLCLERQNLKSLLKLNACLWLFLYLMNCTPLSASLSRCSSRFHLSPILTGNRP